MWYPKDFVYSERTGPKWLGCRHRGQPCLPRSLKELRSCSSPRDFSDAFQLTLSTRTLDRTVIRSFAALSATFPPRTPQLFLTSRFFRHPFSYTFHTRTVVPTGIRTFVLHPVARLASFASSKNSAAAPHLRIFRRLFTLPSMVQSSQRGSTPQFNVCARGLNWKGCIDNVEKPNACHRPGSVRCSCHVTSTESL